MSNVASFYDGVASNYFEQYQRENLTSAAIYPANYFRLQIHIQRISTLGLKSVYEVGVGEGTPLATMAAMGLKVAGCDISKAMVETARRTFEDRGLDPNLIQWGDVEDAATIAGQLPNGPFDAAIAAGVLPHVKNDTLALKNIGMLVRPGGRLFVEFRNKLFSMFTFNRYTKEFILDDLLRDVSPGIKSAVSEELDRRLATDLPKPRVTTDTGAPGYDAILSKFHNPFELCQLFERCGYRSPVLHWYHYHPAPPMLEAPLGSAFRAGSMALEHEGSWRGMFLCSAGLVEAEKF